MSRYVATDWHGIKDISAQVLSYLKPEDELYFLGDAIDRGPDGVVIMLDLLKDKRVTYLLGNHEDMMHDSLTELMEGHTNMMPHWLSQGGDKTWEKIEYMSDTGLKLFCDEIRKMPKRIDIINTKGQHIILTHAGCDPWVDDEEARLLGLKDRYIWDRKHIHHSWMPFEQQEEWKDTYVIHGHTPVLSRCFCGYEDVILPGASGDVVHYAGGHKICLDLFTVGTGRAVLFDLDTFEEIYFVTELKEEE